MYRFEYQEGLDNLIVHSGKDGMLTMAATGSCQDVAIFHIPKVDLLELLKLVARLVTEGHGKNDKED